MRERLKQMTRRLAVPFATGTILGLIGPFGTYDLLPTGPRLAYWLAVVSLNWLIADIGIRWLDARMPETLPARRLLVPVAGALLVAVPATGVVTLANGLSGIGWPENVPRLFAQVLLLLGAISVPVYAAQDLAETRPDNGAPGADPPSQATDHAGSGVARFLARLPSPPRAPILCLKMQDHYLAIHDAEGSRALVLCRMEDAARELESLGARVHRSWWVARAAVDGSAREGQRKFLRLTDGRLVPVGRSYRAALRADGWPV